jgi:Serine acetyltransferase, N-terminal
MDATSSADRVLWSRILAEAEQVTSSEVALAPSIADCVASRANLADALCSRIASLLASPLESAPLLTSLRLLVAENASILSAAGADILAGSTVTRQTRRRSASFSMRRAFSRFRPIASQTLSGTPPAQTKGDSYVDPQHTFRSRINPDLSGGRSRRQPAAV